LARPRWLWLRENNDESLEEEKSTREIQNDDEIVKKKSYISTRGCSRPACTTGKTGKRMDVLGLNI
jgi:hypothetical protein